MSPEKQRAAIAEAHGWTDVKQRRLWIGKTGVIKDGILGKHPDNEGLEYVPNYLNDLNAMHEAEKTLSHGADYHQKSGYGYYRMAIAEVCDEQHPISATASQRAEAFLRTIGKWDSAQ